MNGGLAPYFKVGDLVRSAPYRLIAFPAVDVTFERTVGRIVKINIVHDGIFYDVLTFENIVKVIPESLLFHHPDNEDNIPYAQRMPVYAKAAM